MIYARGVHRKAHGLGERFPAAVLRDVEGLVKLIGYDNPAADSWSLAPGRCVNTPQEEDNDFDFEQHASNQLSDLGSDKLNAEPARLAAIIKHVEGLGQ